MRRLGRVKSSLLGFLPCQGKDTHMYNRDILIIWEPVAVSFAESPGIRTLWRIVVYAGGPFSSPDRS